MYTNEKIKVELCIGSSISIDMKGDFFWGESQRRLSGKWDIYISDDKILFEDDIEVLMSSEEVCLLPINTQENGCFLSSKKNNRVGKGNLFKGNIVIKKEGELIVIENEVDVESFVAGVLCYSYPKNSQFEYLKSQALIVRNAAIMLAVNEFVLTPETEGNFNDSIYNKLLGFEPQDLTSKYLGVAEKCNESVLQAVKETEGLALVFKDEINYIPQSLCCGGITEKISDSIVRICDSEQFINIDLTDNDNLEQWIYNGADSYCKIDNAIEISELLNNEVLDEKQIYRWTRNVEVVYFNSLLRNKFNANVGSLKEIKVVKRGTSGAIIELLIKGSIKSELFSKERLDGLLGILDVPSRSFVIEMQLGGTKLTINGAGTGNSAGICQIGAWKMSLEGKSMTQILNHYLPQYVIEKQY